MIGQNGNNGSSTAAGASALGGDFLNISIGGFGGQGSSSDTIYGQQGGNGTNGFCRVYFI